MNRILQKIIIKYNLAAHYFDELATLTTDEKLRQTTLTIHSLMQCGREHELEWRYPPRGVDLGICTGDTDHGTLRVRYIVSFIITIISREIVEGL